MSIVGEDLLWTFCRLFYLQFCNSMISEKTLQQRFYQEFERYFYIKIIVTRIPSYLVTNLFLSFFFFSLLTNQKQEFGFQQVGGLIMRDISVFCLQGVALYVKAMPNSIEFYKGIFSHVMPVRIIVPCFDVIQFLRTKIFFSWCKKFLLFHLKSSFCYQDIYSFVLSLWSCRKTS